MHPATEKYIQQFEEEARRKGKFRLKIGPAEVLFLENIWGPVFRYNFEGLKAEYPFIDSKGGERFTDFMYARGFFKLIIEIDGFTTHAKQISQSEFEDHLNRQNDLILSGWLLIRLSARQVEYQQEQCRATLQRALGQLWSITHGGLSAHDTQFWESRKLTVLQIAARNDGLIRPREVSQACNISLRTAQNWLKRFAKEGNLLPASGPIRTSSYILINEQSYQTHPISKGGK